MNIHLQAVDLLKSMGYTSKVIEDSMKTNMCYAFTNLQNNMVYRTYKETVDMAIKCMN